MQANAKIALNGSQKQSVTKQLNKEILATLTATIHDTVYRNIHRHLPADIQACFFGSPVITSPAVNRRAAPSDATAPVTTTDTDTDTDNNLLKICEEWKHICNSAQIPAAVDESISPPELTTEKPRSDSAALVLPPLVSAIPSSKSSTGIFSSVKNMFSKKKQSSNSGVNNLLVNDKKSKIGDLIPLS